MPGIGSSSSGITPFGPRRLDVRLFGASPNASASVNRIAIQAAIDAADTTDGSAWTVYIPGGTYNTDRPIFMDKTRVNVTGDGKDATYIHATLDGFVAGIRRFVLNTPSSFVSPDHLVDLYNGNAGGRYLDSSVVTAANQRFGYRTKADSHIAMMAGPFDSGQSGDYYKNVTKLTIDFYVDMSRCPNTTGWATNSGLFGVSYGGTAYPWKITVGSGNFKVAFRTADTTLGPLGGVNRSFSFGSTFISSPGVARITAQIDLTTATVAAWIDGVQQTLITSSIGAGWVPGLSFVSNYIAPFSLGGNSGGNGGVNDEGGAITDLTFCGLKVSSDVIYNVGLAGSAQVRVDAASITDNNRYFTTSSSTTIGSLPLTDTAAQVAVDRVVIMNRGNGQLSSGYWMDTEGHNNGYQFSTPGEITDLTMQTNGSSGTAYLIGFCYGVNVYDCSMRGGQRGIACFNCGSNYPVTIRNCFVGGSDTPFYFYNSSFAHIYDCATGANHRTSFRSMLSYWKVSKTFVTGGGTPDFLVMALRGSAEIDGVFWDNEYIELGIGTKAAFFAQAGNGGPLDGIFRVTNSSPSRVYAGGPIFYLDDTNTIDDGRTQFAANFYAENVPLFDAGARPVVVVKGPRWQGEIKPIGEIRRPTWISPVASDAVGKVRSLHREFNAPPRDGTWNANCSILECPNPAIGGYTSWRVIQNGSFGTATPPVFKGMSPYDDGLNFAAYIADNSYWSVAGSPSDSQGFWATVPTSLFMNALFGGTALVSPGTRSASLGLYRAVRFKNNRDNELTTALAPGYARVALTTPGTFTTSSGGAMSNSSAITFPSPTGNWGNDPNPMEQVNCLQIVDAASLMLLNVDIPYTQKINGDPPISIPIGAMTLARGASSGQGLFSDRVRDWFGNWYLNGTAFTVPSIYIALSTATASIVSGPVEPVGGSYARVVAGTTYWAKVVPAASLTPSGIGHDALIRNALAITFAAPTGNWGLIKSVYLMDALTGGNILASANLVTERNVLSGDPARSFPVGAFCIQMS